MYQFHRSHIAFFSWLAFLAGVAHIPLLLLYLGCCLVAAATHSWQKWLLLPWFMGCGLVGLWRYDQYTVPTHFKEGQQINQWGTVVQPPVLHDGDQRLVVEIYDSRIQVDTVTYPAYRYGDVVQLRCRIRLPEPIEDFQYDKYLARYHIAALCADSQVTVLSHTDNWLSRIYQFRTSLRQRVEGLWPEPVASLMLGVLIGEQDTIPESIYDAFRRAGTVHILVVSGMHVLIIIQLLTTVTKWLPRFYQTMIILILLAGFCVLTGLSATVIRATLMGSVPLLGRLVGRPSSIYLALTWAAGIMTVVNPYILVHDVGFQLSFLATLGLVYATPWVKPFTRWLPQQLLIRETVTTSLAAMLTTAPWIAYIFGTWSNVAVLANIVVVPISNLMLLAGAVLVVLPIQTLATMLGSIVALMIQYVEWCANLPYAYVSLW